MFKNGSEKDDGIRFTGSRDITSLERFIAEMIDTDASDDDLDEAVAMNGLYTLSSGTFHGTIAKGDTFIQFCSPWSRHCKRLFLVWEKLAKLFEKEDEVTI